MFDSIIRSFIILITHLVVYINNSVYVIHEIPENKVIKVIDGDTFEIYSKNKISKVRMIGINSPESVHPTKKLECFGLESSEKLKNLIEGKIVKLESDISQENEDHYGRILRYVYLEDININKKLVQEGYSFEYTFKKPYKFQKEFKLAERNAKNEKLGLWDEKNCQY